MEVDFDAILTSIKGCYSDITKWSTEDIGIWLDEGVSEYLPDWKEVQSEEVQAVVVVYLCMTGLILLQLGLYTAMCSLCGLLRRKRNSHPKVERSRSLKKRSQLPKVSAKKQEVKANSKVLKQNNNVYKDVAEDEQRQMDEVDEEGNGHQYEEEIIEDMMEENEANMLREESLAIAEALQAIGEDEDESETEEDETHQVSTPAVKSSNGVQKSDRASRLPDIRTKATILSGDRNIPDTPDPRQGKYRFMNGDSPTKDAPKSPSFIPKRRTHSKTTN